MRSKLNYAGLLSSLSNILPLGITTSLALWRVFLKFSASPVLPAGSWGYFPRQSCWAYSWRAWRGCDFSLCLTHVSQECELRQCVITAVQAAFSLDSTGRSLTLVTLRVRILFLLVGLLPGWRSYSPCVLWFSHVNSTCSFPRFYFSSSSPSPGGRGVSMRLFAAWLLAGAKERHSAMRVMMCSFEHLSLKI